MDAVDHKKLDLVCQQIKKSIVCPLPLLVNITLKANGSQLLAMDKSRYATCIMDGRIHHGMVDLWRFNALSATQVIFVVRTTLIIQPRQAHFNKERLKKSPLWGIIKQLLFWTCHADSVYLHRQATINSQETQNEDYFFVRNNCEFLKKWIKVPLNFLNKILYPYFPSPFTPSPNSIFGHGTWNNRPSVGQSKWGSVVEVCQLGEDFRSVLWCRLGQGGTFVMNALKSLQLSIF